MKREDHLFAYSLDIAMGSSRVADQIFVFPFLF
jgi:hypothetical protein